MFSCVSLLLSHIFAEYQGVPGGDNFGECTLDVSYSTGIGNGLNLMVSNTNTSSSTEEGNGFGYAFMDFSVTLASAPVVPGVVSLSLGSLSAYACSTLCSIASTKYGLRFEGTWFSVLLSSFA